MSNLPPCAPLPGFTTLSAEVVDDRLCVLMRQVDPKHATLVCPRCAVTLQAGQWITHLKDDWAGFRARKKIRLEAAYAVVPDIPVRGRVVELHLFTVAYRCEVCRGHPWRDKAEALLHHPRGHVQATRRLARWASTRYASGCTSFHELALDTGMAPHAIAQLVKGYNWTTDPEMQRLDALYKGIQRGMDRATALASQNAEGAGGVQ